MGSILARYVNGLSTQCSTTGSSKALYRRLWYVQSCLCDWAYKNPLLPFEKCRGLCLGKVTSISSQYHDPSTQTENPPTSVRHYNGMV